MGIEDAFRDMQDRGLASGEKPIDLSKLTLYQAVCCQFLSSPNVDYLMFLNYDGIDWREWERIHGN